MQSVVSSSENLTMNWSNNMLREKVLVQQSSLEQLKCLPDENAARSADATLAGQCHVFVQQARMLRT